MRKEFNKINYANTLKEQNKVLKKILELIREKQTKLSKIEDILQKNISNTNYDISLLNDMDNEFTNIITGKDSQYLEEIYETKLSLTPKHESINVSLEKSLMDENNILNDLTMFQNRIFKKC